MISGVTRDMLPHLSGVTHLHVVVVVVVVVVQGRQRTLQKSVMHVQNCCFAY